MKKADVKIGGQYFANVTGRKVVVKIETESRHGGWDAINQTTGKKVRIKSAQRLTPMAAAPPPTENDEATVTAPAAAEPAGAGEKKLSAVSAAAKVLAEAGQPMNAKQLIEAMAQRGYWSSPGGKTPEATLYSAIAREIKTKGGDSRFTNPERGKFAIRA